METDTCSTNVETAVCINLLGDYKCVCPVGYEEENRSCVDIDECQEKVCFGTSVCNNFAGGHICQCPKGLSP